LIRVLSSSSRADRGEGDVRRFDFTPIAAWAGVVYVAFVVDTFSRRIVGWSASRSKETQPVLDAPDVGLWHSDRGGRPPVPGELVHHSDAGSQGGFSRWSQHLVRMEVLNGASSAGTDLSRRSEVPPVSWTA
jgi:putative transposase